MLLSAAAVALLAAFPVSFAHAQTIDPPVGNDGEYVESWAVSPVGEDPGEPSSRPNFSYRVAPGGTVEDAVTVWNYSPVPVQFRLFPTDAFNTDSGAWALLKTGKAPKDLGAWISVASGAVTVPAQSSVTVPITLQVPKDASPGDHAAAVLAASNAVGTTDQGSQVNLERRTGPRVYLRVAGAVSPELTIESMSSKYHGKFNPFDGDLDVEWTVRNPGNVRMGATQRLVVKDIFGRTVKTQKVERIDELLPGNAATYRATVSGVPATLRVKATVQVEPFGTSAIEGDTVPEPFSGTSTAWAIPWTLLLLLALAYLCYRLYRRWRDREQEEEPPSGAVPPERIPEPVGR